MPDQLHSDVLSLGYWPTINSYFHENFNQSSLLIQAFAGNGPVDAKNLSQAVSIASSRHPLLNCQLNLQPDKVTLRKTSADVGGFGTMQVDSIDKTLVARELLEAGLGDEIWRVLLVRADDAPNNWLLVMLCHHAIGDGLSMASFFNQVFHIYAEGCLASDGAMDIPVLPEKLSGVDIAPSAADADMVEWSLQEFADLGERRVGLVDVPLAIADMDGLLAACQRERVSLTNLITVALLRAHGVKGRAKVTTAVDIRRRVSPAISAEYFGCYAGVVESSVPVADDIWEHARLSAVFQFRGKNRLIMPVPNGSILVHMMKARIDQALEAGFFAAGCAISDIGELPVQRRYGELTIDSVLIANRQLAGLYSIFLSTYRFDGKLCLNMSFAEPLVSEATANALGKDIAAELASCI